MAALLLAGAWLLCFGRVASYELVWDDSQFTQDGSLFQGPLLPLLQEEQWDLLHGPQDVRDDIRPHGSYRPLTNLVYWLEIRSGADRSRSMHLWGLALGLGVLGALYALALQLLQSAPAALAVTALFAVHPAAVEGFAYVSAQGDLIALGLCLIATWAWLRGQQPAGSAVLALTPIAFGLSLLAKESFLLLPAALFVLTPSWKDPANPRRNAGCLATCALVATAFLAFHLGFVPGSDARFNVGGLAIVPGVLAQALKVAFLPLDVGVARPFEKEWIPVGVALLGGLTVALVRHRHGRSGGALRVLTWSLLLGGTVAPTVFRTGVIADRYVLVIVIGVLLAGARLVRELAGRPAAGQSVAGLVLGLFGAGLFSCWNAVPAWRDHETLLRSALEAAPESAEAHFMLATVELASGREEQGRVLLERAVTLHAYHTRSLLLLSRAALARGDGESAVRWIESALEKEPYHPQVLVESIRIWSATGARERACRQARLLELTFNDPATARLFDENCGDLADQIVDIQVEPFRLADAFSPQFWRMWLP